MKTEVEKLFLGGSPDFDEVIIFHGLKAESFRNHVKAKVFCEKVKYQLKRIEHKDWPYNLPMMVSIKITGRVEMYSLKDIDNMAKTILDTGNGIIYKDDNLVQKLIAEKQFLDINEHGFIIGIKVIDPGMKGNKLPQLGKIAFSKTDMLECGNYKCPIVFSVDENENIYHVTFKDENL